jgi:hypothetical protein
MYCSTVLVSPDGSHAADITVKKLLEGCSVVHCRSLNAQMINGDASDICADVVSINALYCEQARIEAGDNIDVGLSRGALEVRL